VRVTMRRHGGESSHGRGVAGRLCRRTPMVAKCNASWIRPRRGVAS
jgi:hypothetical protein